MTENPNEIPALDDLNGDEAAEQVGEPIEPDHDVTPEAETGESDD